MTGGIYVQYGCGWCAPEQWINFDASPTLRVEKLPLVGKLYTRNAHRFPTNVRYGNVTRGLPIADNSCRGVYCSHVLEHLALEDFDKALAETMRILAPHGLFRLVVPDLEHAARAYLDNLENGRPFANTIFMKAAHLGVERRSTSLADWVRDWLGNSMHLWMWDHQSLISKLIEHGFEDIRRARFNDCDDEAFLAVEELSRFEGACALQARKPRRSAG